MSSNVNGQEDPNCKKGGFPGPFAMNKERAIEAARKFYAADSKLTTEDRREMYTSLWRSWAARPVGGLAFAIAGMMAPNWLKRTGRMNPKRNTGALQFFLGLGGLFFGQGITAAVGYNYYYQKFARKNSNQATAWAMMGFVPSRLPARYYELTSKDPRYIMKDPDTIDWNTEVMFPLNLVAHRDSQSHLQVLGDRKPGEIRPASSTYGQLPTEPGQTTERDSFLSQPPQQPPQQQQQQSRKTGSSWDSVRSGNVNAAPSPPADQGWAPPLLPETPIQSSQGQQNNEPKSELEKEQERFDKMVEQARTGAGVGDDFTETEKKWR